MMSLLRRCCSTYAFFKRTVSPKEYDRSSLYMFEALQGIPHLRSRFYSNPRHATSSPHPCLAGGVLLLNNCAPSNSPTPSERHPKRRPPGRPTTCPNQPTIDFVWDSLHRSGADRIPRYTCPLQGSISQVRVSPAFRAVTVFVGCYGVSFVKDHIGYIKPVFFSVMFLLRHFLVICLTVVLKLVVAAFISLYFQTFWPKNDRKKTAFNTKNFWIGSDSNADLKTLCFNDVRVFESHRSCC